jgi:hypothetical protein
LKIDPDRDFGKRECPACACRVPANSNRCPICGYDFPQFCPVHRHIRLWGTLIMILLLLVALGILL